MLELNLSTLLLQMANFFILLFILGRFLLKPLQTTLEKRAQEATQQLDKAETAQQEANALRQEYRQKHENLDAEIAARKNEVRIVIEQTRQQMLQEVQAQIEALEAQTEKTLAQLRSDARQKHRAELGALAAQLVERILSDVAISEIRTAFQEKFLEQLRSINLAAHISAVNHETAMAAEVTAATELSTAYQTRLAATLNAVTTRPVDLTYRVDPSLVAGVVLRLEDVLIDGSVHSQVQQLRKRYQDQLV
ncbi:MAG: F0F1 ATP synthase subunit delta [Anaerolineae bacterium]